MSVQPLTTFRFPPDTCIPQAEPRAPARVGPDDPAIHVMTDLAKVRAATVDPRATLERAEQIMIQHGVRSLFVVATFPCVEGLITANDLLGDKPLRQIRERGIRHEDLCVADLMTPLPQLDALDYEQLKASTVAGVAATFKALGQSHLLVIQSATTKGPARIRGVVSLTQLERQLGTAL